MLLKKDRLEYESSIFKACSDLTRLRILFLLAARELCVCELVEVLAMSQGKVSRHLALLKQADLVQDRRDGSWVYYSLSLADAPLKRRILEYLTDTVEEDTAIAADRQRLALLTANGALCKPT